MKKAIILIGGSEVGREKVRWAGEESLTVVVVDRDPSAPAGRDADYFIKRSRDDVEGILAESKALSREHGLEIVHVSCGIDLEDVPARIAAGLGISGHSVEAALLCQNKWASKRVWSERGIETPAGALCRSSSEALAFAREHGYPMIVKSPGSSGSRGVTRVGEEDGLKEAIREALVHSTDGTFLIERLVSGTHHDVNGIFWNKKFHPCGIMDRYFYDDAHCMSAYTLDPTALGASDQGKAFDLLERATRALGIEHGPVKGDFILGEGGFCALEVAPRFHGDIQTVQTSVLGPGVNAYKALFRALSTGSVDETLLRAGPRHAGWKIIPPAAPGLFRAIRGKERALAIRGVEKIFEYRKPGQAVGALTDNTLIPGVVVAGADNRNDLMKALDAAIGELEVVVDER